MSELTEPRLAILRGWRFIDTMKNVKVVRTNCHAGHARTNERRNIAWLVENGYLEANAHGDWYFTAKAETVVPTCDSCGERPAHTGARNCLDCAVEVVEDIEAGRY